MAICTHKKFINMSLREMDAYLDEIFGGEPHRILAEVINVNNSYAEVKALYLLIHGETAQPFNFFPDKDVSSIKISGKLKEKLSVGNQIICTLRVRNPDAKGQVFTVRDDEIDYNFSAIEDFYKSYGLTYDAKNIYELFDGENLNAIICGDFKENLMQRAEEIISELDAELANKKAKADAELAEKYSELKKRTAEVDAEIEKKYSDLDKLIADVDAELAAKKSELQSLQEKIYSAQTELENFNDELSKIKKFFGIDDEEKVEEKISVEFHEETNFDEYIYYWQGHLLQCHGLTYRKEILESVFWGLHTDQLILLTGSPGTGKTSLVRALPECFGWENSAIIPVQANWTDKSDLLGYYNPLEKNYMSTPFLDALLKFCRKAEKNSKDVFIICLDEMNLAHVEHYFAEFLSVLQSDEREIRLYGDELRRDIYRELKYNAMIFSEDDTKINFDERRFMNMNLEERKYYLQLCRMANMFFKYPATFKIPKNIKFFGTLNQDATTLDISPKVIDRSFVIRVEKSDEEIKLEFDPPYYESCLDFYQSFSADYHNTSVICVVRYMLYYFNYVFPLSQRAINVLNSIMPRFNDDWSWRQISYWLSEGISDNEIAAYEPEIFDAKMLSEDIPDILFASFVLPKVRFDAKTDAEKITALKNLCEKYPYSKEILEKYMTSPDGKEIDYWRA